MQRQHWRLYMGLLFAICCVAPAGTPQPALTWQERQERLRAKDASLFAGPTGVEAAHADEIAARLFARANQLNFGVEREVIR